MVSLENNAYTIKGYLLSLPAPPTILSAMDDLLNGLKNEIRETYHVAPSSDLDALIAKAKISHGAKNPAPAKSFAVGDTGKPGKKRARDFILTPEKHLEDIQRRHNLKETNGSISKSYDCSDQTIVNFLKAHGTYTARRHSGRAPRIGSPTRNTPAKHTTSPRALPAAPEPKPRAITAREAQPAMGTDIIGETLAPALPPVKKGKSKAWSIEKYNGRLQAGDLMDIHDMLAQGKDTQSIAEHYQNVTKAEVEEFILHNQNAQMTKCKTSFNPGIVKHKQHR